MALKVLNISQLPKALADSHLKNRDKGVLSALSLSEFGKQVTIDYLVEHSDDGRTTVRSAISSLEKHGYLFRKRERNEAGIYESTNWIVDCSGSL